MTEPPNSRVARGHGTTTNNDGILTQITFTAEELSVFRQRLPDGADRAQQKHFAWYSVKLYKSKGLCNDKLSEYYAEDFKSYSEEDLASDDIPWPEDDSKAPSDLHISATLLSTGNIATRILNGGRLSTSKFVSNVSKAYCRDEDGFSGKGDNFERKPKLFNEPCTQNGLKDLEKPKTFSITLTERALQYYFDHLQGKRMNFEDLCSAVRKLFFTEEHTRGLLREWENITLATIMSENNGKKAAECLITLISRLEDIQSGLTKDYQRETNLKNKPVHAVKDSEARKLAYYKPADTLEEVIADLHSFSAAVTHKKVPVLDVHFVDRKFGEERRGRDPKLRFRACFVCKRKGCWSTNHANEERLAVLKKNKSFRQFTTSIVSNDEDKDSNDGEEIADHLEDMAAHDINFSMHKDSTSIEGSNINIAQLESEDSPTCFLASLFDSIRAHSLTARICDTRQYLAKTFFGILIDQGFSRCSSRGLDQYRTYCRHVGQNENIDSSETASCRFGIGNAKSLGVATITLPINNIVLNFSMHVIDSDLPILLSLADMDRFGLFYNNLEDKLYHFRSGYTTKVLRKNDHSFLCWNSINHCFFTETELRRLHKRFGHPHAGNPYNVLRRSELPNMDSETRDILGDLTRKCLQCQRHAQAPRHFKSTLREEKKFNYTVLLDIFYIDKRPILHVVDESTRYQAACWLPTLSTDAVWRALGMCWIGVYLGPPDVITHDDGKPFMAKVLQSSSEMLQIQTKPIPMKSPSSMSFAERYHIPARRAYNVIKHEAPETGGNEAPQVAVKSVNDTAGPDGLAPTLLVSSVFREVNDDGHVLESTISI